MSLPRKPEPSFEKPASITKPVVLVSNYTEDNIKKIKDLIIKNKELLEQERKLRIKNAY